MTSRVHVLVGQDSQTLSRKLKQRADTLQSPIWLVPTDHHHDSSANCFIFPQLALKLASLSGKHHLLSGPQERLLFHRIVDELNAKRKLRQLRESVRTPGGLRLVFDFVAELKQLGVDAARFTEFAAEVPGKRGFDPEIALIHQTYDDLLAHHQYLDRAAVYRHAINNKRWPNLGDAVLVDGFAAFAPPELALLTRLAQHAGEMWLTLPGDEHEAEHYSSTALAEVIPALPTAEITYVAPAFSDRPAGLNHLTNHLFCEEPPTSQKADGLTILEAPGVVGEVRMVARAIKQLFTEQPNDSYIVAVRKFDAYADVVDEIFREYEIPFATEGTTSLAREPAVAGLLRAASVAENGWQFRDVSALLRNTLFRPQWPEVADDPEMPLATDVLLRQLGEPRGRDAFLNAAEKWAESPPLPLEDEEEQHSQRALVHELAKRCLTFLRRFLEMWDDAPSKGDFAAHAQWMHVFAERLGLPPDIAELQQLHADIAGWVDREQQIAPRRTWSHGEFMSHIQDLAQMATRPRASVESARVRVLGGQSAAGLACDHLFIVGMGERDFPDLHGRLRLSAESERAAFRGVGLDLDVAAERLPQEKLLFLRLVSAARKSITLSYPATDDKGQELLAGSFLRTIRDDLFEPNTIATISQQMLIESLTEPALSVAEKRIRFARNSEQRAAVSDEQIAHLTAARHINQERFERGEFGSFNGLLDREPVRKQIAEQFGPNRPMSPTSLEAYVSCPFKFFSGRVLRLAPLAEPSDEIETHLRGAAYHRALARLHRDGGRPVDQDKYLAEELASAVQEYADRAGSKTTKILWQLELDRLLRSTRNFGAHCNCHREEWSKQGSIRPLMLEEKYEVTIELEGRKLNLRGRIDRVDIVETETGPVGFVVIDYKTGAGSKFTKPALQQLRHLQLPVYALAVEQRLGDLQPLGLLYWLPLEKGPKTVLAGKHLAWSTYRKTLETWLLQLADNIRTGQFPLSPRSDDSCHYCDYHRFCRIAQGGPERLWSLSLPVTEVADEE